MTELPHIRSKDPMLRLERSDYAQLSAEPSGLQNVNIK